MNFKETARNKALANHTLRTIWPIIDLETCVSECYMDVRCITVNLCEKSDGKMTCNLLDSDHIRNKNEMVDKQGCVHYGSENACSSSPCRNNGTCQGDFAKGPVYRCICPAGYTGTVCNVTMDKCAAGLHDCHANATCTSTAGGYECKCNSGFHGNGKNCHQVPKTCAELKSTLTEEQLNADNTLFPLPGSNATYSVFCSFANFSCGEGKWSLAMKIDGNKLNFRYGQTLWIDKNLFQAESGKTGLDDQETKTEAYSKSPLNKVCIGMKDSGTTHWLGINITDSSLYHVMKDGSYHETYLGKSTWENLISDSSLHNKCKKEGFNIDVGHDRKLRIGIMTNSHNHCWKGTSYIGIGGRVGHLLSADIVTCGNLYTNDNDVISTSKKAFCYILVK